MWAGLGAALFTLGNQRRDEFEVGSAVASFLCLITSLFLISAFQQLSLENWFTHFHYKHFFVFK